MMEGRFDRAGIGRWTAPRRFPVTREAIIEYARAINDEEPAHLRGDVAPPVFAVVAALGSLDEAARFLAPDAVFAPSLHVCQDIQLRASIAPATTLLTQAAPLGIAVRNRGTTVVLKSQTREEGGELLNMQFMSVYFPACIDGVSAGELPPEHSAAPTTADSTRVPLQIDLDQPRRFALASGDHNPMHLDSQYARAAGFEGVIVHGLCTMAFCGRAVIKAFCGGAPERLRRLAVRFSRPVYPGALLTTALRPALMRGTGAYEFEAIAANETVIRDGLAEIDSVR